MASAGELQAIILAGGKGERLRPFTDDRPKPMVQILEKPILEYQVRWLASPGRGARRHLLRLPARGD